MKKIITLIVASTLYLFNATFVYADPVLIEAPGFFEEERCESNNKDFLNSYYVVVNSFEDLYEVIEKAELTKCVSGWWGSYNQKTSGNYREDIVDLLIAWGEWIDFNEQAIILVLFKRWCKTQFMIGDVSIGSDNKLNVIFNEMFFADPDEFSSPFRAYVTNPEYIKVRNGRLYNAKKVDREIEFNFHFEDSTYFRNPEYIFYPWDYMNESMPFEHGEEYSEEITGIIRAR